MPRLSAEAAASIIEIEQLVAAYWRDGDMNAHHGQADMYAEDGVFDGGPQLTIRGREAIRGFYDKVRAAKAAAPGGTTTRHLVTNLIVTLEADGRAVADYFVVTYSGAGAPTVGGVSTATRIADGRFEYARDAAGEWKIQLFRGATIFEA